MAKQRTRMLGLNLLSFDFTTIGQLTTHSLACPGPMSPLTALALSSSVPIMLFILLGLMFGIEALYRYSNGTYTSLTTLRYFNSLWRLMLLLFSCTLRVQSLSCLTAHLCKFGSLRTAAPGCQLECVLIVCGVRCAACEQRSSRCASSS